MDTYDIKDDTEITLEPLSVIIGQDLPNGGPLTNQMIEEDNPFLNETVDFSGYQWDGIWIEVALRVAKYVNNILSLRDTVTESQEKVLRAQCYKVLGAKMQINEPVKLRLKQIIRRAVQLNVNP